MTGGCIQTFRLRNGPVPTQSGGMPMADPAQRQLLHEELLGRNANSLAHTKKWKSSSHLALNVFRCLTNRRQFAWPQQIEFPLSLGT